MIIDKAAINEANYKNQEYYYDSARNGMFDLLDNMVKEELINILLLPGYIGWSPREGSGIFDPINKLEGLTVQYYKMTSDLSIDISDLTYKINNLNGKKFAVLIVNYFGFVDTHLKEISDVIKQNSGWIIEDNAHGFFTYHNSNNHYSDAILFSLHKMFPMKRGGSLVIKNNQLKKFKYKGSDLYNTEYNPWLYEIQKIANIRLENYFALEDIINIESCMDYFTPLKTNLMEGIIPQTFPIRIIKGDRNRIYQLMNESGYGVVSLYHTLIEPLRCSEYQASLELSRCIMNLPLHQDVDKERYRDMVKLLVKYCQLTSE